MYKALSFIIFSSHIITLFTDVQSAWKEKVEFGLNIMETANGIWNKEHAHARQSQPGLLCFDKLVLPAQFTMSTPPATVLLT